MSDASVARTEHELRMVAALVDCAHALSLAVADAAEAEADSKHRLQLFEAFQRGFLAVRMGIRLSMMLRAARGAVARPAAEPAPERERPGTGRPEVERRLDRAERNEPALERDRDRDRDYEPVSLPKFLSTLGVVASDAARIKALPAHVRADILPKLDTLLARAKGPASPPTAGPAAAVALLTRPRTPPKAALLSGAAALSGPPPAFHGKPRPPPYRFG